MVTNQEEKIDLPKSNVLQYIHEEGSKISMRPSGTEPKIKFYFGVKNKLDSIANYEKVLDQREKKINSITDDLAV